MGKLKLQLSDEEMAEYSDFFKFMRKSIGYSQQRMAEEIGVFYKTIARWEKGISIPQNDVYELEQKYREAVKRVRGGAKRDTVGTN